MLVHPSQSGHQRIELELNVEREAWEMRTGVHVYKQHSVLASSFLTHFSKCESLTHPAVSSHAERENFIPTTLLRVVLKVFIHCAE